MIAAQDITLSFGERVLFKDVSIKFTPGNCYGIIGANGAGKSTFLKILAGEIEPTKGNVVISEGERIAVLQQDHFQFDGYSVLETVIMGHKRLYDVMIEKEGIYSKEDFSEEDGLRASVLETEFTELNGWEAESEAATLLAGLGIPEEYNSMRMGDLEGNDKVRVLLAQALFGNPDILLLDEPTNNLDMESIDWIEDFLSRFQNTVIVVSHDRHFLNRVCTHIADIDYGKIQLFVGNYDFWYQSSQLIQKQMRDDKKRRDEKIKELKEFIQRFSSNVAKARQATSRRKLIDKLTIDDLKPTLRRFPYVQFQPERECGKSILTIIGISKKIESETAIKNFSMTVYPGDKIAFVGPLHAEKSLLLQIISGGAEPDAGTCTWGVTIKKAYFPRDNNDFFKTDLNLVDWLRQYTNKEEETDVRSFLGRMLFSGEESLKKARVLSGGERVRCMLARMMLSGANLLILDEPTNHLDLEAITALNNGLINFKGVLLFISHDHEFVASIANRIIELTPEGHIDRQMTFDDYLVNPDVKIQRDALYHKHLRLTI